MTTRRRAAHDSGEDIWGRVAAAGEAGLLAAEARGEYTPAQFEHGKAWIKDVKCRAEQRGWVYHHGSYVVTVDPHKCTLYATDRLRSLYKQAQRIYNCSLAILPEEAQALPTVRLLRSECEAIFAAMDVLQASGFSVPTALASPAPEPARTGPPRRRTTKRTTSP